MMNLFDQAVEEGYTIVTTVPEGGLSLHWQAIGMAMQKAAQMYDEVIVLCKTYHNKTKEWFIMGRSTDRD